MEKLLSDNPPTQLGLFGNYSFEKRVLDIPGRTELPRSAKAKEVWLNEFFLKNKS